MNIWPAIATILYILPVFDMLGDFEEICDDISRLMMKGEMPWFPSMTKWIAAITIFFWPVALMFRIIWGVTDRD
jgi:hypothetical protein